MVCSGAVGANERGGLLRHRRCRSQILGERGGTGAHILLPQILHSPPQLDHNNSTAVTTPYAEHSAPQLQRPAPRIHQSACYSTLPESIAKLENRNHFIGLLVADCSPSCSLVVGGRLFAQLLFIGCWLQTFAQQKQDESEIERQAQQASFEAASREVTSVDLTQEDDPWEEMSLDSFRVAKVLGKGSYGTVLHVQHKQTNQAYALKVMALAHPCWWHWHTLADLMALCDCCWHWHSVIAGDGTL